MADLKTIYQASTREKAEHALNRLDQKWGKQYPKVIASWRRNYDNLLLIVQLFSLGTQGDVHHERY